MDHLAEHLSFERRDGLTVVPDLFGGGAAPARGPRGVIRFECGRFEVIAGPLTGPVVTCGFMVRVGLQGPDPGLAGAIIARHIRGGR